jgi:hypothetical protein
MLLMYADPARTKSMPSEEVAAVKRKHDRLHRELPRFCELIRSTARPNGPLLETSSEHLTAYHVVDREDADALAAFAEHLLDDHVTAVEVRRIHDWA